jgi:hypothetical protein
MSHRDREPGLSFSPFAGRTMTVQRRTAAREVVMGVRLRLAVMAVAAALVLVGCSVVLNGVVGSGPVGTETRTPGEFTRVDVRHGIQVQVAFGEPTGVRLEGQQNLLAITRTTLDGDRLIVDTTSNYTTSTPIRATVTVPRLDEIAVAGGARGEVRGVEAGPLVVRAVGGASLTLAGTASEVRITAEGGAVLDLAALEARSAMVNLAGGVAAKVHATDAVTGTASGGVILRVSGDPDRLEVQTSGGAVVLRDA